MVTNARGRCGLKRRLILKVKFYEVATLVQLYEDNFKKPESERNDGLKVKFRYEDFHNENGGLDYFPINWDNLYDMLNLSELDANILRGYAL